MSDPKTSLKTRKTKSPREARTAQETVQRLLDAALIIFSQRGYEGARVDQIAQRAAVNKQLVYYHFKNKVGLYTAVLELAYESFFLHNVDTLKDELSGMTPSAALQRLADVVFRRTPALERLQRLIHDANIHGHLFLKPSEGIRSSFEGLIGVIGSILREGARAGEFREGIDAKEFYISMLGSLGHRISNATTISLMLGVDLTSDGGQDASRRYATDLLIHGIDMKATA